MLSPSYLRASRDGLSGPPGEGTGIAVLAFPPHLRRTVGSPVMGPKVLILIRSRCAL